MGWGHIRKVVQTPGMHSIAGPHLCPFSLAELHSFSRSFAADNFSGDKNSYCCKSWKL